MMRDAGVGGLVGSMGQTTIVAADLAKLLGGNVLIDKAKEKLIEHLKNVSFCECLFSLINVIT
jgi:hypothetical protein